MKGLSFNSNMYSIFNTNEMTSLENYFDLCRFKMCLVRYAYKPKSSISFYFFLTTFLWNWTPPTLWKHRRTDLYGQITHPIKACCFLWISMYVFPPIIWRRAMLTLHLLFPQSQFTHCTKVRHFTKISISCWVFLSQKRGRSLCVTFCFRFLLPCRDYQHVEYELKGDISISIWSSAGEHLFIPWWSNPFN